MRYRVGLETRDRILEATRELIGERGLAGATVKAICERAGVLAGSFYNQFESKDEAVLTVIGESIRAVEPPADRAQDIASLVDAYVAFVENQEGMARVYLEVVVTRGIQSGELRGRLMRHHQRRVERFAAALASADVRDPVELAELMVAALNGLAVHRLLDPRFDLRGQARRLLDLRPAD